MACLKYTNDYVATTAKLEEQFHKLCAGHTILKLLRKWRAPGREVSEPPAPRRSRPLAPHPTGPCYAEGSEGGALAVQDLLSECRHVSSSVIILPFETHWHLTQNFAQCQPSNSGKPRIWRSAASDPQTSRGRRRCEKPAARPKRAPLPAAHGSTRLQKNRRGDLKADPLPF